MYDLFKLKTKLALKDNSLLSRDYSCRISKSCFQTYIVSWAKRRFIEVANDLRWILHCKVSFRKSRILFREVVTQSISQVASSKQAFEFACEIKCAQVIDEICKITRSRRDSIWLRLVCFLFENHHYEIAWRHDSFQHSRECTIVDVDWRRVHV